MSDMKMPSPSPSVPPEVHMGTQNFIPKPSNLISKAKDVDPKETIKTLREAVENGVFSNIGNDE